jgi:FKBP-type peptidyl-prolyl cis-trans isomerase
MTRRAWLPITAALFALVACSKLTEPPKEEAIQAEGENTPAPKQAASAAPSASAKEIDLNAKAGTDPRMAKLVDAGPEQPLQKRDLVVGKGAEAKTGDTVTVDYVGTLPDGKEFDASKKHGDRGFTFTLGQGRVIKGWDQGVPGMKVGGKRKLMIPPNLGYGPMGSPPVIPPNSYLNFDVELRCIGTLDKDGKCVPVKKQP